MQGGPEAASPAVVGGRRPARGSDHTPKLAPRRRRHLGWPGGGACASSGDPPCSVASPGGGAAPRSCAGVPRTAAANTRAQQQRTLPVLRLAPRRCCASSRFSAAPLPARAQAGPGRGAAGRGPEPPHPRPGPKLELSPRASRPAAPRASPAARSACESKHYSLNRRCKRSLSVEGVKFDSTT